MGIFSRLFQRGQDGSPPGDDDGDGTPDAIDDAKADATDRTDLASAPSEPGVTNGAPPPAAPVASPPMQTAAAGLPGLAFAGATAAPAEAPRSMWDWPGPTRDSRRSSASPAFSSSSDD